MRPRWSSARGVSGEAGCAVASAAYSVSASWMSAAVAGVRAWAARACPSVARAPGPGVVLEVDAGAGVAEGVVSRLEVEQRQLLGGCGHVLRGVGRRRAADAGRRGEQAGQEQAGDAAATRRDRRIRKGGSGGRGGEG